MNDGSGYKSERRGDAPTSSNGGDGCGWLSLLLLLVFGSMLFVAVFLN
jgi:hypothetical protein